jgi:hypothetical protein
MVAWAIYGGSESTGIKTVDYKPLGREKAEVRSQIAEVRSQNAEVKPLPGTRSLASLRGVTSSF